MSGENRKGGALRRYVAMNLFSVVLGLCNILLFYVIFYREAFAEVQVLRRLVEFVTGLANSVTSNLILMGALVFAAVLVPVNNRENLRDSVGGGLSGGAIGGVVLDVLAMLFSVYVFGPLMTKLIPALGGVASGYVYLLVFLCALVLVLLTFFCGLVPFLSHFGAVSKKSRLKNLCKKLKRLLPALAEERQLYGRLVDLSVICEAKMRWEDASYVGLPRGEASYRKLRAVRGFFRELCRCYDRAQAYLAQQEA